MKRNLTHGHLYLPHKKERLEGMLFLAKQEAFAFSSNLYCGVFEKFFVCSKSNRR